MKNFLIFFACLLASSSNSFGTTTTIIPEYNDESTVYFKNAELVFEVTSALEKFLISANVDSSNEYFSIKTLKKVEFIQILNGEGQLEFQLPVQNKLIHIALDNFIEGDYKINILFENQEEYLSTELTKI